MFEELRWKIVDHWKVIALVAVAATTVTVLAMRGGTDDPDTTTPAAPPTTVIAAATLDELRNNPEVHPRCAQIIDEYLAAAPDATGTELAALNAGVATTCGNHHAPHGHPTPGAPGS